MIDVYVASAFCHNDLGGNKAGVVLFNEDLSDKDKKKIAKELGYAETAFINNSDKADYKIEYFTPAEEVPLCGHATIASFGVLKHLVKLAKKNYTIETKSGRLGITIENDEIFMEQNIPAFYEDVEYDEIKNCFDLDCISKEHPISIVSTGLKDILVPIKNEEILHRLSPNFEEITKISKKYSVVGTHLFTFTGEKIICRNFAPLYDVNEESATGTSNCALAGLLFMKLNLKRKLYIFEQGYSLNLPSTIKVKIDSFDGEKIDKISVGGQCKFIDTKNITL